MTISGYVTDKVSSVGEAGYLWSSERDDLDDEAGMIRYAKCLVFLKNDR